MHGTDATYVRKACAYVTREPGELLVFEGPDHDGLQVPKGTVETDETPREAVFREVAEESGLGTIESVRALVSDVWCRRESPERWYVRSFFEVSVHGARDGWVHTVSGGGGEDGSEFAFSWVDPTRDHEFALDLDDYLFVLSPSHHRAATG